MRLAVLSVLCEPVSTWQGAAYELEPSASKHPNVGGKQRPKLFHQMRKYIRTISRFTSGDDPNPFKGLAGFARDLRDIGATLPACEVACHTALTPPYGPWNGAAHT